MPRKTVEVKAIVDMANQFLLNSEDDNISGRDAMIYMVENVLIDTGNYAGYSYLDAKDMESSRNGTTVGIRPEFTEPSERFLDTDHTRLKYHLKTK